MVGTEVEKRIGEDRMKIVEEIKKWKQKKMQSSWPIIM